MIFVTPAVEANPRSGGEIRSHRLLSALGCRTEVTLVVVGSVEDPAALRASTGVASVRVFPRLASPWHKRRAAVAHRWPLATARVWQPSAAAYLRERRDELVIFDHLRMAGYRPETGRYVVCLQDHNSRLLIEQPMPRSPLRAAEYAWDRLTLPAFERKVLDDPRARVFAVSTVDAERLGPHVSVVTNGTDLPDVVPQRPLRGPVLFVGSLDYPPNREAVVWWAEEIWPHLAKGTPALRVVGRGGAAALGAIASHPSLEVVGEVADVSAELASSSTVVIPLRSGSGTRLKLLEALAWGRPVVTTTKGAEGIPVIDRRHALIADGPKQFARAVGSLYEDDALARRLAAAGQEFVLPYDWKRVGAAFADSVIDLANG